jgi:hypothetical protein
MSLLPLLIFSVPRRIIGALKHLIVSNIVIAGAAAFEDKLNLRCPIVRGVCLSQSTTIFRTAQPNSPPAPSERYRISLYTAEDKHATSPFLLPFSSS